MRYLLDTCALIWFFEGSERIGTVLRDRLTDPENVLLVSDVSLLEITIKYQVGKFPLSQPPSRLIPTLVRRHGMDFLALVRQHILQLERLPMLHRDPFDRLLVAQAQVEKLVLITPDPLVRQYDVTVLWE